MLLASSAIYIKRSHRGPLSSINDRGLMPSRDLDFSFEEHCKRSLSMMSTRNALPELLLPYLQPPSQGSLILATYVLGATNNWLLLRYLKACLDGKSTVRQQDADGSSPAPEHEEAKDVSVVLVSWMREFDFWRTEARKAVVIQETQSENLHDADEQQRV